MRTALLVLLLALQLACARRAAPPPRPRPPPHVVTTLLRARPLRVAVRAPVDVRPVRQVEIGAKVLGYLAVLTVDRGDRVRAGQLLGVVRPSDLPAQVAAARGGVAQNAAAVALARANLERAETLAPQGVVSQQELASARAALATAEAQGIALRAQALGAGARLADTRLVSPMDGVVLARRVDPGALVGPSTGPVLTVVATDALRVFVPVTERDAASVRLGQTAELTVDALPGRTFAARVSRLAPAFDAVTRTLDAEVLVPNPDGALRPGMYGRAVIVTGERAGAVLAPVSALQRAGERWFAFVVRDGRASRREVTVGVEEGEAVEVTRGLAAGDELVTAGLDALSDNAAVRVARGADPFRGPATPRAGHGG
ncbi:MAG: efflux RND transporter periplasmic adaptor subunit [Polyangiales bacterium]